jgi:hypothetical protein
MISAFSPASQSGHLRCAPRVRTVPPAHKPDSPTCRRFTSLPRTAARTLSFRSDGRKLPRQSGKHRTPPRRRCLMSKPKKQPTNNYYDTNPSKCGEFILGGSASGRGAHPKTTPQPKIHNSRRGRFSRRPNREARQNAYRNPKTHCGLPAPRPERVIPRGGETASGQGGCRLRLPSADAIQLRTGKPLTFSPRQSRRTGFRGCSGSAPAWG